MFTAGVPYLFPCWLNGLVCKHNPPQLFQDPTLCQGSNLSLSVCLAYSVLNHFSVQIQQKMLDVKKGVFSLNMLTRINTSAKCSGECSRKGRSKGWAEPSCSACCGNPALANAGLHHMEKAEIKMLHPSGGEGFSQTLKPWKICTFIFPSALFAIRILSWVLIWRPNPLTYHMGYCTSHILSEVAVDSRTEADTARPSQNLAEHPAQLTPPSGSLGSQGHLSPVDNSCRSSMPSLLSQVCATQLAILSRMSLN